MKLLFTSLLFICCFFCLRVAGQVSWRFSAKKIANQTYEIHLKAAVDDPWHIYSQNSPKGGPLPTKITFTKNPLLLLQGKAKEEGDMQMEHSTVFDVDVYSYKDSVDFVQTVKLKSKVKTTVSGTIEFMACTNEQCLAPQTIPFTVKID